MANDKTIADKGKAPIKYPENIMKNLRQRRYLQPTDTSEDDDIMSMSGMEALYAVAGWHLGDRSWANIFEEWIETLGGQIVWPNEEGSNSH